MCVGAGGDVDAGDRGWRWDEKGWRCGQMVEFEGASWGGGGDGIAALRRDEEGGAHDWSLALARSQPKAKQCDRARTWIPGVPHVTD